MKKTILLFVSLFILSLNFLNAQNLHRKTKYRFTFQRSSGQTEMFIGKHPQLINDSILTFQPHKTELVKLHWDKVQTIEVQVGRKTGLGIVAGLGIGTLVGVGLGYLSKPQPDGYIDLSGLHVIGMGIGGALVGSIVGGIKAPIIWKRIEKRDVFK